MPVPSERLERALLERGGVARVSSLQRGGHSRHHIRRAIEHGTVHRVRRDWVALPAADPLLVAAARSGVVLSCLTQARRLGLWVIDDGFHVAASPHARVSVREARVHWAAPVVPRDPDDLVDPIENVLALVSTCRPHEEALAVWESALRQRMTDAARVQRLPLPTAARRLLDEASSYSDSGLETIFRVRLRRFDLTLRWQIWIDGHHVDLLVGERLVVQIDGGHHVGAQRTSDIEHDARLRLLGYTVYRVGYRQVVDDWASVQWLIMQAIAQGLHLAR